MASSRRLYKRLHSAVEKIVESKKIAKKVQDSGIKFHEPETSKSTVRVSSTIQNARQIINTNDDNDDLMEEVFGVASNEDDATKSLLLSMQESANGLIGGVGSLSDGTMDVATRLASGTLENDTMVVDVESRSVSSVTSTAQEATATMKQLKSQIGQNNGAIALLNAVLDKALNRKIAKMMQTIVNNIKKAHNITHPLFCAIFKQTWGENMMWIPEMMPCSGACKGQWLELDKLLCEYFDFVQKVMGGVIADIDKQYSELFDEACAAAGYLSGVASTIPNVKMPSLTVNLMSISKQVDDLLNKISKLKELIKLKAKQILAKLKSLEAPELYINMPEDFKLIFSVLVEAEFIMNNLPIAIDKILEYFLTIYVQKFAEQAEALIDKILEVWEDVVEIVPPLKDLISYAWLVPCTADKCVNIAINIALDQMWSYVEPKIMAPFNMIKSISDACDAATELAYAVPTS